MAFIRTMRGPARGRSAGFVPSSLACAARRVTLSTGVRFADKAESAPTAGEAPGDTSAALAVPAADSRP